MIRSATPFPLVSLFFMFIGFVLSNIGHIRPQRTILAFISGIFFILSGGFEFKAVKSVNEFLCTIGMNCVIFWLIIYFFIITFIVLQFYYNGCMDKKNICNPGSLKEEMETYVGTDQQIVDCFERPIYLECRLVYNTLTKTSQCTLVCDNCIQLLCPAEGV